MDFSKISYERVNEISSTLASDAGKMESILNEVVTEFNKVGNDDVWSGTAASSTKSEFDALAQKFPEFYEAITDCSKYLSSVVANMQSVDAAVTGNN